MKDKKTVSRRDFLKGAAAGTVSLAAAGLLGACSGEEAVSSPSPSLSQAPSPSQVPTPAPAPQGASTPPVHIPPRPRGWAP